MNLQEYRRKKLAQATMPAAPARTLCLTCLQPAHWCYCPQVKRFNPGISFAILLHPIELRRRLATGRMSFLCLQGSHLILGHDYSQNEIVNQLLADPAYFPVVLQPGPTSIAIDKLSEKDRNEFCPKQKKLLVFVVDGTWHTADKTMKLSKNLKLLPKISFTPPKPSIFRVRKQPKKDCYSSIEAIHQTIEVLGQSQGFDIRTRQHDHLLELFDSFITRQLQYIEDLKARTGTLNYRKRKTRSIKSCTPKIAL